MDKLLTLEPGMLIWTFITFSLLLFILKKFAWKPLLDALGSREESIRTDLQRAEKAREESERLVAEHKLMIAKADEQVRGMIEEAKKAGEKVRDSVVSAANEQARQMILQASAEIVREKDTALAQLRSEVADLAIRAAEKILGEDLNDARHRNLVDSFISGLPKN
jgi:F-type H+-transporting ATPase subunit b